MGSFLTKDSDSGLLNADFKRFSICNKHKTENVFCAKSRFYYHSRGIIAVRANPD